MMDRSLLVEATSAGRLADVGVVLCRTTGALFSEEYESGECENEYVDAEVDVNVAVGAAAGVEVDDDVDAAAGENCVTTVSTAVEVSVNLLMDAELEEVCSDVRVWLLVVVCVDASAAVAADEISINESVLAFKVRLQLNRVM